MTRENGIGAPMTSTQKSRTFKTRLSRSVGLSACMIALSGGVVFAQAVIVNSFQEVLREHARTDNGAKQLKRIFDTMRKDQYDRVRCVDLHRAVRRYDAAASRHASTSVRHASACPCA